MPKAVLPVAFTTIELTTVPQAPIAVLAVNKRPNAPVPFKLEFAVFTNTLPTFAIYVLFTVILFRFC